MAPEKKQSATIESKLLDDEADHWLRLWINELNNSDNSPVTKRVNSFSKYVNK